jgi:hypothetical protein
MLPRAPVRPVSSSSGHATPSLGSPAPELFWIGTTDDRRCLWPRYSSRVAADLAVTRPLDPFLESVVCAQSRVWILDPHFEGTNGYAILQTALELVLDEARKKRRPVDVRILTSREPALKRRLDAEGKTRTDVKIKGRDGFHDRYALVDGDLWHFGSTVGGADALLSSASRGWADHAADFERLFLNWWVD